jgi:putative membrane protein
MTRNPLSALLTGAAIAGLTVLPLLAQGQQGGQQQQQQQQGKERAPGQEQKADAQVDQFLTTVMQNGHGEIALARLALDKSKSEQVRALAQKLVTDHEAVNQKVMALASARKITLRGHTQGQGTPPSDPKLMQLSPDQRAVYERLDKLSGAQFDRAWADQIIKSHQSGIDLFMRATKLSDEEVRTFAQQTLPALRDHLKRAQEIQP